MPINTSGPRHETANFGDQEVKDQDHWATRGRSRFALLSVFTIIYYQIS